MTFLEVLTLNLAVGLVKATAKLWFKDQPLGEAGAGALAETFKKKFEDFSTQRATERLFSDLQDVVAHRLARLVDTEFSSLPENERCAAGLAVAGVFESQALPPVLLESDLDATKLENALRPAGDKVFADFGADTRELASLLLRESCNYVVTLVGKLPDFQLVATREILKRHTEVLADLTKVLDALDAMRTTAAASDVREARDFELQYRRALARRLDRLELFGVRVAGGGVRDYALTVAYVSLTATGGVGNSPLRVEEALGGGKRIVIRGEAGSGKTTLLQWLAVRAANRDFQGPLTALNGCVPLYLTLRKYTSDPLPRPEQFIDHTVGNLAGEMPKGWCQTVLRNAALILIDGVDELPAIRRKDLSSWLKVLVADFQEAVIIVSSRPAALDAEKPLRLSEQLVTLGFKTSELQPMSLADSEALVTQWHAAVARDLPSEADRQDLKSYQRSLNQILGERSAVRNLASTPLLCAMICALNWYQRRRVPDDRMELYRVSLEMLLDARDDQRDVKAAHVSGLDRQAKEELLAAVGYWMLRNDFKEAQRDSVEDQVELALNRLRRIEASKTDVLQELLERSGVIREPQSGTVGWIHRTFLEYMGSRAAIAAGDLRFLAGQADRESWREAVVFGAGHAKGKVRDQLIRELLKRPWLRRRTLEADVTAVCCLETAANGLDPNLLDELKTLARSLFPPKSVGAAQLLAPAAAMIPDLLEGHSDAGPSSVAACIRAAAVAGGSRMLDVIAGYHAVSGDEVDREIVRAWLAFDRREFLDRVIRRRETLFGLRTAELGEQQAALLETLSDCGIDDVGEIKGVLRGFGERRSLIIAQLGYHVRYEVLLSALDELSEFAVYSDRLSEAALTNISKLASLRHLHLGKVDAPEASTLRELRDLQTLSLVVEHGGDLGWLVLLEELTRIGLEGEGVVDISALGQLKRLEVIALANCSVESIAPILNARTATLSLDRVPLKEFEGLERAENLSALSISAMGAAVGKIPYERLRKLTELRVQEASLAYLDGIGLSRSIGRLAVSGRMRFPIDGRDVLIVDPPVSLEYLRVSYVGEVDLDKIGGAQSLATMNLHDVARVRNAEGLLALPNLLKVSLYGVSQVSGDVLNDLRRRGVDVTVGGSGPLRSLGRRIANLWY